MTEDKLLQAVQDLTRVTIAFQGEGLSKSEAIRRLNAVGMPPSRIAALLMMAPKDVTSQTSKIRKADEGGRKARTRD